MPPSSYAFHGLLWSAAKVNSKRLWVAALLPDDPGCRLPPDSPALSWCAQSLAS